MKKRIRQALELFIDGFKEGEQLLPKGVGKVLGVLWIGLYILLLFVVGILAWTKKSLLLGICELGFLVIVVGILSVVIYERRRK